jgi:ADP-ribose pyrophosphatase
MDPWKLVSSEYVYQTPFGNLRRDTCELPDRKGMVDYYVHEYSDWVNAIVVTKDKKIILVEQYRHPGGDFFLEIPAGKVEENETHEEGIIREVREETGYISTMKPILLGEFMVNPATQTNKVISYLLVDAFQAHPQEVDLTEVAGVKVIDFDELDQMINDQVVNQLFTVCAFHLAKNKWGTLQRQPLPTVADFRNEIETLKKEGRERGKDYIELVSLEIHKRVGLVGKKHRMASCCIAMYDMMKSDRGDEVISAPPKGKGSTLKIKYYL